MKKTILLIGMLVSLVGQTFAQDTIFSVSYNSVYEGYLQGDKDIMDSVSKPVGETTVTLQRDSEGNYYSIAIVDGEEYIDYSEDFIEDEESISIVIKDGESVMSYYMDDEVLVFVEEVSKEKPLVTYAYPHSIYGKWDVKSTYKFDGLIGRLSVNGTVCDDSFLESWAVGVDDSKEGTDVFFRLNKSENIKYVKFTYGSIDATPIVDLCDGVKNTDYISEHTPSIKEFIELKGDIVVGLNFIDLDKNVCEATLTVSKI